MGQMNQSLKSNLDDRLADFTDEALAGRIQQPASHAEVELLLLEETILRLKNAFPADPLDEARLKQMLVRLKSRIRRETEGTEQPFWKNWLIRPQTRLAAALGILFLLALAFPYLTADGSSTPATALTPSLGIYAAAGLAAVIVVILWIKRRK